MHLSQRFEQIEMFKTVTVAGKNPKYGILRIREHKDEPLKINYAQNEVNGYTEEQWIDENNDGSMQESEIKPLKNPGKKENLDKATEAAIGLDYNAQMGVMVQSFSQPSPATSLVEDATCLTRLAPRFMKRSVNSMFLATVTPSLVILGAP